MNYNKTFESISISEKQSDIGIVLDLVSKHYLIKDSTLIRFQQKAEEQLFQKTKDLILTITHPVAKKLLTIIINR